MAPTSSLVVKCCLSGLVLGASLYIVLQLRRRRRCLQETRTSQGCSVFDTQSFWYGLGTKFGLPLLLSVVPSAVSLLQKEY